VFVGILESAAEIDVDPSHRPHKAAPYRAVRTRVAEMKKKGAEKE